MENQIIKNITREGKGGITSLGIFQKNKIKNLKEGWLYLIPYGKQSIEKVECQVIYEDNMTNYVSLTLYCQRNNKYKLKVKNTNIFLA